MRKNIFFNITKITRLLKKNVSFALTNLKNQHMKKLFTLIVASLLSIVSVNAQNCDFTVTQNPSGSYTFTGPSGLANSGLAFQWSLNNGSVYQSGYSFNYTYPTNMTDVVSMYVFAGGPDSSFICTSTQTITVTGTNQGGGCTISALPNDSLPNTYNFSIPGANYPATWTFSDGTTASGFDVSIPFVVTLWAVVIRAAIASIFM